MIGLGTFECTDADIMNVVRTLQSGLLSSGPELHEFENKVAKHHSYDYGIMVNSGQSALEVALILAKVKLKKRDLKVIVPATTYAATLWAVINAGCTPIFADIRSDDYTINCEYFNDKEYKKADVLLSVDLCGKACEIPKEILDKYFVISDSCEAFGNKSCNYADIACFSFYVSHLVTTGSGGMVCTKEEWLSEYARSYISHGRKFGGDFTQHREKWTDRFYFDKVGTSYRSDNLSASLGLSQMGRLAGMIGKRKQNALSLINMYEANQDIQNSFKFPTLEYLDKCVFQFFPIVIKHSKYDREKLLTYLYQNGIDSRVLLSLTNQPIFKELYGPDIQMLYPESHYCNDFGFIVGCHQDLDEGQMKHIIKYLKKYIEEN